MFFGRMGTTLSHPAPSSWWWLHFPPDSSSSESEEEYVNDKSEPEMVLLPDNEDDTDEVRVIGQSTYTPPSSPDIIKVVAVDQARPRRPPLGPAKTPSRKRQGPQNPGPSDGPQNPGRSVPKRPKVCFKKKDTSRPILLEDPAIIGKSYF